jgi:hypothetical protein
MSSGDSMSESVSNPAPTAHSEVFARPSILAGNIVQVAGISAAFVLLAVVPAFLQGRLAVAAMVASWILLYFCCHGIAHWAVGRILGIRFVHYTIAGTANPRIYPPGIRWIFAHLPFFGVRTDKASMQQGTPLTKALMWSAGVTSSALLPTLSALWSFHAGIPASKLFLGFATIWALATLASNWTSETGDFAKAKRAFKNN